MAWSGEKSRPIASMSWLRCTTRIGSGIASPLVWAGKPLPFQRSNVWASASRTSGPKSSRPTRMSATSHPDEKLCTAHSWADAWSIRMISSRSSSDRPAVAKATTSPMTSPGSAASCTSVRARIAISSPNTVATSWAWPVQPT